LTQGQSLIALIYHSSTEHSAIAHSTSAVHRKTSWVLIVVAKHATHGTTDAHLLFQIKGNISVTERSVIAMHLHSYPKDRQSKLH